MIHFKHNWVEVERFYAEPIHSGELRWTDKMLFGQTTILYKCVRDEIKQDHEGCGLTRQEKILGKSIK